MKAKTYFIAYATGLNIIAMAQCCHDAEIVGQSELEGFKLLFRGEQNEPMATIEPAKGYNVPVLVWELTWDDVKNLDQEILCPQVYEKCPHSLIVDGEPVDGFTYILRNTLPIGQPSNHYLNLLLDGYEENGFDPTAVEIALEIGLEAKNAL